MDSPDCDAAVPWSCGRRTDVRTEAFQMRRVKAAALAKLLGFAAVPRPSGHLLGSDCKFLEGTRSQCVCVCVSALAVRVDCALRKS